MGGKHFEGRAEILTADRADEVDRREAGLRLLVFEKNHSTSHGKVGHRSGVFFPRTGLSRLLGIWLLGLAMFSVAGGHWAVLQTVAWVPEKTDGQAQERNHNRLSQPKLRTRQP